MGYPLRDSGDIPGDRPGTRMLSLLDQGIGSKYSDDLGNTPGGLNQRPALAENSVTELNGDRIDDSVTLFPFPGPPKFRGILIDIRPERMVHH